MNSKTKILIGILIIIIFGTAGWWIFESQREIKKPLPWIDCAKKGEMPFGKNCCKGLISRAESNPDGTGECVYPGGQTPCMACGDGICEGPPMNENECNCPEDCEGIIVTTDKTEYVRGQIVYITVRSNLEQKIGVIDIFNGVERFENDGWVNIWDSSEYQCSCDSTCYFGEIPEIGFYGNMTFEWNQKMWIYCNPQASFFDLKDSTFVITPHGIYRIQVRIYTNINDYPNEQFEKIIYSNKFIIKDE